MADLSCRVCFEDYSSSTDNPLTPIISSTCTHNIMCRSCVFGMHAELITKVGGRKYFSCPFCNEKKAFTPQDIHKRINRGMCTIVPERKLSQVILHLLQTHKRDHIEPKMTKDDFMMLVIRTENICCGASMSPSQEYPFTECGSSLGFSKMLQPSGLCNTESFCVRLECMGPTM